MNPARSEIPSPLSPSVLGDATERYDVVVAGFGIAGGSAALEAAREHQPALVATREETQGRTPNSSPRREYALDGEESTARTGNSIFIETIASWQCSPFTATIAELTFNLTSPSLPAMLRQ